MNTNLNKYDIDITNKTLSVALFNTYSWEHLLTQAVPVILVGFFTCVTAIQGKKGVKICPFLS